MAWKRFNPGEVYDFLHKLEDVVACYARVREIESAHPPPEYEKEFYSQMRGKFGEMESMLAQVGACWRPADDYIYAISNLIRKENEGVSKQELIELRNIVDKKRLCLARALLRKHTQGEQK